jgi:hypothetical protein
MGNEPMEDMEQLISRHWDGDLTAEEFARLAAWLQSDAEHARSFMRSAAYHGYLRAIFLSRTARHGSAEGEDRPAGVPLPPLPVVEPPVHWPLFPFLMFGGVLLVAAVLCGLFVFGPRPPMAERQVAAALPPAEYAATLSRAVDCRWQWPQGRLPEGSRLLPGRYVLTAGVVEILFDSGPAVMVRGPTELEIVSRSQAKLVEGTVLLKNNLTTDKFTLRTPLSTLWDIGTEYAVNVAGGSEEIQVFDGLVRRTPHDRPRFSEEISKGQAWRYVASAAGRPIPLGKKAMVPSTFGEAGGGRVAQPQAYEGFDYPAGPISTGSGGFGWSSPWKCLDTPPMIVRRGSLTWPGHAAASVGGAIEVSGLVSLGRQLQSPIPMDRDGIHYVSFLFRRFNEHLDNVNAFLVQFQEYGASDGDRMMVIGVAQPDQVLFLRFLGSTAQAAIPFRYGATYLLVGKIVCGRTAPDQLFVKIYGEDDRVDRSEPAIWSLVSRPVHSEVALDTFVLHVNSHSRESLDEIRIGRTWASVTMPWSEGPAGGGVQ